MTEEKTHRRTVLKIEERTSPNGRYAFTLSFLMNGEWHPTNYAHSTWVLREWALAEIERGTYAGPVIEPTEGLEWCPFCWKAVEPVSELEQSGQVIANDIVCPMCGGETIPFEEENDD